jgi:hypothetical protein
MRLAIRLCIAALFLLAGLSACTEEIEETVVLDTQSSPLEGSWQVQAIERHHGCPEVGSLVPVEPGAVTFSRDGATWLVSHARGEARVAYREVEPNSWTRSVRDGYAGCELRAEAQWRFHRVIDSRFSASYSAVLTLSGEDCEQVQDRCTVDYAVNGLRRP